MLCLCDKDPGDNIDVYKDFAQLLRRKELEEPFILLDDNSMTKIRKYIELLIDIKLDHSKYYIYYGEVKFVVNSFLTFYTKIIDDINKKVDKYSKIVSKEELIMLIDKTITAHQIKQDEFRTIFLPTKSPWEKRMFDEIENQYKEYMPKLNDIRDYIVNRLDKKSKIDDFAKGHFPIVMKKMSEIFDTAQLYVSMMLADNITPSRISLEEILRRLRRNLTELKKEREDIMKDFLSQLYEKNKESMSLCRNDIRNNAGLAEASHGINHIKKKMESHHMEVPIERLEKEVKYWTTKLDYLNEICNNLKQLRALQTQLDEEQDKIYQLKCHDLPACQHDCTHKFRVAFSERREEVRLRIINETRALFTFYAVRGTDHILYHGDIGPYFVDEYNHQNYVFDYGLEIYHLNCDGAFKIFPDNAYLFDKYGRYIIEDGEKLYQCAPCTSKYKLNEGSYLEKVTEDCGHSEMVNKRCHVDLTDRTHVTILPDFDPIDIQRSLDPESVRYLWDSFGSVLPEALHDVGHTKPKNPIHYLAHKLLYHKYKRTSSEHQKKKEEAEKYRAKIMKQRKEKAEIASKLWKSKQVKRRKPEESDDAEFRAYLDARIAQDLFINSLNMDL